MAADLPGPEDIALDPDLLKTLASDSRRDILRLLKERRMTLTELSHALELGKATVLEHLQKLQAANLIVRREDERLWVYYELTSRGRRVVTPGRTRFFLVMGTTAAAALVAGILLTLAFTHAPGPSSTGNAPVLESPPGPLVAEGDLVAWRGLSEGVTLRLRDAPSNGSLFVDGLPVAPVEQREARLTGAQLDALSVGAHDLSFMPSGGNARVPIATPLDVRDPRPALLPLQVVAGRTTDVLLGFADPATPIPASVAVDGTRLPVANLSGVGSFPLRAAGPGPLLLQVGRLAPIPIDARLDATPTLALAEGNLTVHVTRADGSPAVGMDALLDEGAPVATNASGDAALPRPAEGDHALTLREGGAQVVFPLRVSGGTATLLAPDAALLARGPTGGPTAPVTVQNRLAAAQSYTLVTLVDGRLAASAPVSVGALASRDVDAAVPLLPGSHAVELQLRGATSRILFQSSNATSAPVPTTTATPTAASPATGVSADQAYSTRPSLSDRDDGSVIATLRLDVPVMTSTTPSPAAATTPPSPAVPGFELIPLVAALGAALLALRRRSSG